MKRLSRTGPGTLPDSWASARSRAGRWHSEHASKRGAMMAAYRHRRELDAAFRTRSPCRAPWHTLPTLFHYTFIQHVPNQSFITYQLFLGALLKLCLSFHPPSNADEKFGTNVILSLGEEICLANLGLPEDPCYLILHGLA